MKNHWRDRQSEILPDHTALATANVLSVLAVIEDDDAEVLNGYRKCAVTSRRAR